MVHFLKRHRKALGLESDSVNRETGKNSVIMARSSQYWVMVLVVFFVAAATASLVGADEAAPTIAEQAEANAHITQEKVKNEAAPTIAEKLEATKEATIKQADQAGETVKSWKDWAVKTAGEWTGKATETAKVSGSQAQESASGIYTKWSTWAKDTAEKYRPKKNPAAEAAAYIEKHTPGSTDEEL